MTESMAKTIDETNRRREKQIKYNLEHNIVPTQIIKSKKGVFDDLGGLSKRSQEAQAVQRKAYNEPNDNIGIAADPVVEYMNKEQLQKLIVQTRKKMEKAAKELDFMEAARLRDELLALEKMVRERFS
jgi:excinuclease ABC subunit B